MPPQLYGKVKGDNHSIYGQDGSVLTDQKGSQSRDLEAPHGALALWLLSRGEQGLSGEGSGG